MSLSYAHGLAIHDEQTQKVIHPNCCIWQRCHCTIAMTRNISIAADFIQKCRCHVTTHFEISHRIRSGMNCSLQPVSMAYSRDFLRRQRENERRQTITEMIPGCQLVYLERNIQKTRVYRSSSVVNPLGPCSIQECPEIGFAQTMLSQRLFSGFPLHQNILTTSQKLSTCACALQAYIKFSF